MQRLELSTDIYLPPQEIYEFLVDFPQYAAYSEYLERVDQHGDGDSGTEYDLVFSWWKLSYTARSRVTDVAPPEQIDWRIIKDIHAQGHWRVEATDETTDAGDPISEVFFLVEFDRSSADSNAVDIPRFITFDAVLDRVIPKIQAEATKVVERVVADLEGQERDVELQIHETPSL